MSIVSWIVDREVPGGRIRGGFTNRYGGASSESPEEFNLGLHVGDDPRIVLGHRDALGQELGVAPGWMDQVHGARIGRSLASETLPETDGMVVGAGDAAVQAGCVMVADCVPLLLLREDEPLGAVVHVGRAGFLQGIAAKAVETLGGPECTIAVIGPSICGNCYEVPEALRDQAALIQPSSAGTTSWGTPSIDIPGGLRSQLEQCGVDEVIEIGICTRESDELFSHRRASALGEKAGRFVGIVQTIRDTPSQLP